MENGVFTIKELLFKRKSRFTLYMIACLLPVVDQILLNYGMALLLGSLEKKSLDYFISTVVLILGFILLGSILYILSRFMRISYMRDTLLDIRVKAFEKILNTSYRDFNLKSKETYISNLINDINIFENNFFLRLINITYRGGVYIVSLIILAFIDIKFAISIFIISIALFAMNKVFEKPTIGLQEEVSNFNEDFSIEASNTFNGLEILKLNNLEDSFLEKSLKSINKLENKKLEYNVFIEGQSVLSNFLGYLIFIGTTIYLLTILGKGIPLTTIIFMLQLANSSVWSMVSIPPLINEFKASVNIYERITEGTGIDAHEIKGLKQFKFDDKIKVKNLSFQYGDKEIFKDLSFTIEKGKRYLLKGASGSGKSTLIRLLSKMHDDYKGEILLDGVDYRDINVDSINESISFIYQDVFLFEDSILNNITLFKEYDKSQIAKVVEQGGLEKIVDGRKEGLNEVLWENGKNLSGGERQRISIARAIIKESSILFIDEATSNLDEDLGRHIEDTILSLDSTIISISHRYYPGITEEYDYVLEIKNGKIIQYSSEEYFQEVAII